MSTQHRQQDVPRVSHKRGPHGASAQELCTCRPCNHWTVHTLNSIARKEKSAMNDMC